MKTEIVFILDKSGSMAGLEKDTIGGFNALIDKQKQMDGEVKVTTVLFNHHYTLLHDRIDIKGIAPLTEAQYNVSGTTALLDAIGNSIKKMQEIQSVTLKESHPDKIIFVITTDGEENSSTQYNVQMIKKLISKQKELGWEFMFLGANIDAIQTASQMGLHANDAVDFIADSQGTKVIYEAVAEQIISVRSTGKREEHWKASIEKDTIARKKIK
jgi:uncharacterized protein YegL